MKEPLRENVEEQFEVLRQLNKRVADDLEQSRIIFNHLEDKFNGPTTKKRVKFTPL